MKPTLIILHGALGCTQQFTKWSSALSANFDCHIPDFSGHGTKAAQDIIFSIELFSKDLKKYILENNLSQPNILGYSMGGYIALWTALQAPELLGNMITLATKFDWNPESSQREAGYLKPAIMLQKIPQLADQLKERHWAHWEKVVERTATMMLELGTKPLLTIENVKEIKNKVRCCVGDKDKMVSVAETQSIYRSLPNGSFCVLPATGHLPETMDLKRMIFEVEDLLLGPGAQASSRG